MDIEKIIDGDLTKLNLNGKLDTVTAPKLESFFSGCMENGENEFEVDLLNLKYLSSAGLRVLLSVQKKLNRSGGSMVLVNVSAAIREIFDITGFSGVLTVR